MDWIKSRKSAQNGACVELAREEGCPFVIVSTASGIPSHVLGTHVCEEERFVMRNSRRESGPILIFTKEEIDAFLDGAKNGEFDHLIGIFT